MTKQYYEIPIFKNIYLEDSFVISIIESDESLIFNIEAVLTEEHQNYTPPKDDEQYCYRDMVIRFSDIETVNWLAKNPNHFTDANQQQDLGNIDSFYHDKDTYHLSGDWGEVEIMCHSLSVC